MKGQPSLLEYAATQGRARHDGPDTSKAAAKSMAGDRLLKQQALVLEAVDALGDTGGNAHEVQDWLRDHGRFVPERNAVGSRFAELIARGWVVHLVGVAHEKGGKVHAATEAGRERLARYLATVAA